MTVIKKLALSTLLAMGLIATLNACGKPQNSEPAGEGTQPEWAAILDHYQSLGEHRSGTTADRATSLWLQSELKARGLNAGLQDWPLSLFQLKDSHLQTQGAIIEMFPFWYPAATGPVGLEASLVMGDGAEESTLEGAVVLFRVPPGKFEVHYDVAPVLKKAAARGALAAVVILDHPVKAVSAQNANRPYHQQALTIPALIAADADADKLLALAKNEETVRLVIDGENQQVMATNVIGKINRGARRWIVISTPISGWFEATNERGPGIAMWLQLAHWVVQSDMDANFLFAGLSGHELGKMGMEALVDSGELPGPEEVALWLHLGSGIAVETPLLSAVSSVTALSETIKETLVSNTAMTYWPAEKMPRASEQYRAMQLGYPVAGLFGADPNIHTRLDQAPRIDNAEYNKVFSALQELIRRQLAENPPIKKEVQ